MQGEYEYYKLKRNTGKVEKGRWLTGKGKSRAAKRTFYRKTGHSDQEP